MTDTAGIGHNSTIQTGQLRAFIERVERLEEDKKAVADDIKEVYAEMKGAGYDTKTARAIVRLRKMDPADRAEQASMIALYAEALGVTGVLA
jgi:uncharacterized protein (UPF0335 family)